MVYCTPEVMHLAIDLHIDLIEMPSPMVEATHTADPLPANISCEQWSEAVPPQPHSFMTQVNPALEQQIFDIPQRQWEPHIEHHHHADDLW